MNKRKIYSLMLLILLFAYLLINRLFIMKSLLEYSEFISASVLLLLTFMTILLLGYKKSKTTSQKKDIIRTVITRVILFFAISYGIGLLVGFLKNSYSLAVSSIINNVFAPLIIIVCIEIFRYIIINANKDDKFIMILTTIILALIDLSISIKIGAFNNYVSIFKTTASIIIPTIIKNAVLSYITYYSSCLPCIFYRTVMEFYVFIIPIIPNLGEYINCMIGICLPFSLYISVSRIIANYENLEEHEFVNNSFSIIDIPVITFIVIIVCLISCAFPHYILGIASGSMSPTINKGDAVIVEKLNTTDTIKENEIIVFEHENKTYIHRLVRIETKDDKTYYITKGDANVTEDNIQLSRNQIKGVVSLRIPYIGYPTVYLSEFLDKE